ncbi:acetylserotonin O-methyltransferase [Limnoglobus roseus]|uniref:Methyltransferase n=1 Tax=Limnoglobus roseus TaxID=2598579 RepID=A0A5C1ACJ6_9BACT|nr:acetylserotonin O-methyltransferase [Limnoglobus roseus]QEL17119.1 methyltransferase [Limnoglobus roseus]
MSENAPLPPEAVVTQMIFGKWVAMALSVAAKLRLADALAAGPRAVADLAAETNTHAPSLYRLLRALASAGVFAEDADGRFRQTPLSAVLRTGVPGSMRAVADYCGADWSWRPWGQLMETVRTGATAFDAVFGEPVFDHLAKRPAESAVFNEGMTGFSTQAAPAVAASYDFSPFGTIVDVGGGHGHLLCTILARRHSPRGVVFDAPHVAAGAGPAIAAAGLSGRCRAEGGDFFAAVPAGDAYVLKHIIHDWPDDKAATILRNCRATANAGAKLVLVEIVIPPGNDPSPGKWLDLEMLAIASGKERTEKEYAALLTAAGWRLARVVSTGAPVSVIEGVVA